jgi:hypothetical protein
MVFILPWLIITVIRWKLIFLVRWYMQFYFRGCLITMTYDCPCEDEKPDPCPKCGATVSGNDPVHGRCQAGAQFDEILRLKDIIKRARLAVTASGLTALGYENACKQAKDILDQA